MDTYIDDKDNNDNKDDNDDKYDDKYDNIYINISDNDNYDINDIDDIIDTYNMKSPNYFNSDHTEDVDKIIWNHVNNNILKPALNKEKLGDIIENGIMDGKSNKSIEKIVNNFNNIIDGAEGKIKEEINNLYTSANNLSFEYTKNKDFEKTGISLIQLVYPDYKEGDKVDFNDIYFKLFNKIFINKDNEVIKIYKSVQNTINENNDMKCFINRTHELTQQIIEHNSEKLLEGIDEIKYEGVEGEAEAEAEAEAEEAEGRRRSRSRSRSSRSRSRSRSSNRAEAEAEAEAAEAEAEAEAAEAEAEAEAEANRRSRRRSRNRRSRRRSRNRRK